MSTYLYLECIAHDPPIRSYPESGRHLYDLSDIRADIANRDRIVAAMSLGFQPDDSFRYATAEFLQRHPHCPLRIFDEYGGKHPIAGDDDQAQSEATS